jgi:Flp pilus assembly protein TadD
MARPAKKTLTATQAAREARRLVDEIWRDMRKFTANYRRAQALLRSALARERNNTLLLTCLGTILSDVGRHREAVVLLKRAMALGATDRHTVFNLGVATLNAGNHAGAMRLFRKASGRPRPGTWEAYFDPHGH